MGEPTRIVLRACGGDCVRPDLGPLEAVGPMGVDLSLAPPEVSSSPVWMCSVESTIKLFRAGCLV
jgi:hypothetical protein